MDNTITFELPANEYKIKPSFNHREGYESILILKYSEEGPVFSLSYSRSHDPNDMTYYTMLTFPSYVGDNLQKDFLLTKLNLIMKVITLL